ncbi:hypothetical protein V9T40_003622 [Parthenolecanium corni]|uniref:Uncharacterized protein n=1 Tax=Parthenolecanium corni TaxID=536013 RepID=A0AAN9U2U8_9HEMI
MALAKVSAGVFLTVFLQSLIASNAKPFDCGCGGVPPSYPFPAPVSPPISFVPVPQPVPVKIPAPRPQSVTIPNIILALLPPTNKPVVKPCLPPPVPRPQPIVLPIPQPYPLPVPDCGYAPPPCGC